jgi:hypothetical protein
MIEVIREGIKKKVICPFCEAVLRYTADDIQTKEYAKHEENRSLLWERHFIICPLCDEKIMLEI